jgi:hypothetical protein
VVRRSENNNTVRPNAVEAIGVPVWGPGIVEVVKRRKGMIVVRKRVREKP